MSYKNIFNPLIKRGFDTVLKSISVAWDAITGKPTLFPPEAHTHPEYIPKTEKAISSGVATLDINAKIPLSQLPDSILGQVIYQGLWSPANNTPALPNPTTVKGHYYIASDAGVFNSLAFQVGDWVISDGINWDKVDNTDAVSSVFGRTGNISAQLGDYSSFFAKKQSSVSDTTTGRGLITGAFGLNNAIVSSEIDLNNYKIGGFYISPVSGLLNVPIAYANGRCHIWVNGQASYTSQLLIGANNSSIPNRIYVRTYAGTWSAWKELGVGGTSALTTVSPTEPTSKQDGDRWILPDPAESGSIQKVKDMLVYKNSVWYSLTGAARYIGKIILTATNYLRAEADLVSVSISRTDRFFRFKSNNGVLGKFVDNDLTKIFTYAQNDILPENLYAQISHAAYVKLAAGTAMPYIDQDSASNAQSSFFQNRIYADFFVSQSLAAISTGTLEFYVASKANAGSNSRLYFFLFPQTNIIVDKLNAILQQIALFYVDNLVIGKNTIALDTATIAYLQAGFGDNFGLMLSYGGNSSLNENDYLFMDTKDIKLILQ